MSDQDIVEEKVLYQPESSTKNFNGNYEKYLEKLFRTFKNDARATRPEVVGQLTDLLEKSSADTYLEWEQYYRENYLKDNPEAVQTAVDSVVNYLEGTINKRLRETTRDDVRQWIQMLLYYRSPTGMFYESTILNHIADENDMSYIGSSPKEEAEGIDGFLDGQEVQVKPKSYDHGGTNREIPSVPTVVYDVQGNEIYIETEQLSIITENSITVSLDDLKDLDTGNNPWHCDMEQGYEKIINKANGTARANRKSLVGNISELTDMCPYNDVEGWVKWYQKEATELDENNFNFKMPVDNPVEEATEETYNMIKNWRELTDNISQYRDQIESMVWRLIIFETHDGLSVEGFIFDYLSSEYDLQYDKSTAEEESKAIDGFLNGSPIQVKPESYDRVDSGIDIDPAIVSYSVGSKYVTLEYNESEILES